MSGNRAAGPGRSRTRAVSVELVRRGRARTRRDLAEITGLSRSVVAQVVADLIADGSFVESEESSPQRERSRGRPSTTLRVATRDGLAAGLDLSHRRVSLIVADLHQRVLVEQEWPYSVDRGAAESLGFVESCLRSELIAHGRSIDELVSVVVSLPFPVVDGGEVVQPLGAMPAWSGVRPRQLLNLPNDVIVRFGNDAGFGAWGELVHDRRPHLRNLLYAKVGDGLGAGIVLNGEIFEGTGNMAGEIGHVISPECTLQCRCGRIGCLDALITAASSPQATSEVLITAGRAVGLLLAELAAFIAPDVVVVGGELSTKRAPFFEAAESVFAARSAPHQEVLLRTATLGFRAERCGALDRAIELAWTGGICAGTGRIPLLY